MELMQLEMFVAVVEEGSVQKAAARVYRTPPAVSMALRKLEQEIGKRLLQRSSRSGCRPTRAGEVLYSYARSMLILRNEAVVALRNLTTTFTTSLRVGADKVVSEHLVGELTSSCQQRYPGMNLRLVYGYPRRLLREIREQRLDLALLSVMPDGERPPEGLVATPANPFREEQAFWIVQRRDAVPRLAETFVQLLAQVRHVKPGEAKR